MLPGCAESAAGSSRRIHTRPHCADRLANRRLRSHRCDPSANALIGEDNGAVLRPACPASVNAASHPLLLGKVGVALLDDVAAKHVDERCRISKRLRHPRTLDDVTICRHATSLTQLTALVSPPRGFTSHECTARRAAGLLQHASLSRCAPLRQQTCAGLNRSVGPKQTGCRYTRMRHRCVKDNVRGSLQQLVTHEQSEAERFAGTVSIRRSRRCSTTPAIAGDTVEVTARSTSGPLRTC